MGQEERVAENEWRGMRSLRRRRSGKGSWNGRAKGMRWAEWMEELVE